MHQLAHLLHRCLIQIEGHVGRLTPNGIKLCFYRSHACIALLTAFEQLVQALS